MTVVLSDLSDLTIKEALVGIGFSVQHAKVHYDAALERRRLLIQQAREAGMTLNAIAEALGITRPAVINALKERPNVR